MEKPKATTPSQTEFERLKADASWLKKDESQQEFLERYVRYTDALIGKIEAFDETENGEPIPADFVIYLDKSARPISWMVGELWPLLANRETDGTEKPMPETRFLNIDREPWRIDKNVEIAGDRNNFRQPTGADIQGLRSIFALPGRTGDELTPLDGKRILIVDEVSDSGDTMWVAEQLLSLAFPESHIKGFNWMNEYKLGPHGEKQVLDKPIWYESDEESGRGIFGQQSGASPLANKKSNLTEESHQFLSVRPAIPAVNERGELIIKSIDERGRALRRDIAKMAMKLASGELMPPPAEYTDREWYNGMPIEEYGKKRREALEARGK